MQNKHRKILPSTELDDKWLDVQLDKFNNAQLSFNGTLEQKKSFVIKEGDKIIAGVTSCIYLEEILYVYLLFVDENYRHQGLGSQLLQKAEDEARAIGAKLAHLDTFDFQAKDFYLKHGYEIFGILENCPESHKRYYLKKILD